MFEHDSPYQPTDSYYTQRLFVRDCKLDRYAYFSEIVRCRTVLHVGCADWPVFNPSNNLHARLLRDARCVDGCDIQADGIRALSSLYPGTYFLGLDQVLQSGKQYDVVLLPEVLEHVRDAGSFIDAAFTVPATDYVISVPNFKYWEMASYCEPTFLEHVHRDHKAWYSPYTLYNLCRPNVDKRDKVSLCFLSYRRTIVLRVKRAEST